MPSYNFHKKKVIKKNISVQEQNEQQEHILWGWLVLNYECYFYDQLYPFHMNDRKNNFMYFYHDYNVDVTYNVQVDNVIYAIVHDNNWWHWMIPENYN